jgi:predicted  nucleic acid-binding Zn-ribbon protein
MNISNYLKAFGLVHDELEDINDELVSVDRPEETEPKEEKPKEETVSVCRGGCYSDHELHETTKRMQHVVDAIESLITYPIPEQHTVLLKQPAQPVNDNIEVEELKKQIEQLKDTIRQTDVNYYKDKVENQSKRIAELEKSLDQANVQNEQLQADLERYKEQCDGLNNDLGAKTFEISELNRQLESLKEHIENDTDEVQNGVLYSMLQDIRKELASSTSEAKTLLTEDEASEIMDYIIDLHDTYFADIPFSSNQFKQFVWNVPHRMYEGMIDCIDKDEPDIINPMTLMYIAFTDEPAWAMGRFLTYIEKMIDLDSDSVYDLDKEYTEALEEENDNGTVIVDKADDDTADAELVKEDDYNEQ